MKFYRKKGDSSTVRQIRDNSGRKVLGIVGTMVDLEMQDLLNPATASDDVVPYFWWACISSSGKVEVDPDRDAAIHKAIKPETATSYGMEEIYTILQQRDDMARSEAVSLVSETKEMMADCGYDPSECEEIVMEMLGLEIDYIPVLVLG